MNHPQNPEGEGHFLPCYLRKIIKAKRPLALIHISAAISLALTTSCHRIHRNILSMLYNIKKKLINWHL